MTILHNLMNKILIVLSLLVYPIVAALRAFYAWKTKRSASGFVLASFIGFGAFSFGTLVWTTGGEHTSAGLVLLIAAAVLYAAGLLVFANAMVARNNGSPYSPTAV